MTDTSDQSAASCPVDPKARAAWLEKAKTDPTMVAPHPMPPWISSSSPTSEAQAVQQSCDSSTMDQSTKTPIPTKLSPTSTKLALDREISSIPRLLPKSSSQNTRAANNEAESGTSASGHWVYPSERMFFDALQRKNMSADAADMRTIIPIHNAVNERAWAEILAWEKGRGGDSCGGPRLESFSGLSTQLTPKARFNSWLGYSEPFDRHDWVVDRCGLKVEYVIDFYEGRNEGIQGKPLNFYLDVRPKLNTVEGWKMRIGRIFGL